MRRVGGLVVCALIIACWGGQALADAKTGLAVFAGNSTSTITPVVGLGVPTETSGGAFGADFQFAFGPKISINLLYSTSTEEGEISSFKIERETTTTGLEFRRWVDTFFFSGMLASFSTETTVKALGSTTGGTPTPDSGFGVGFKLGWELDNGLTFFAALNRARFEELAGFEALRLFLGYRFK